MGGNTHLSKVSKIFLCLSHSKILKCFFASNPWKKLIYSWSFENENELSLLQCTNKLVLIHMGQMFHNTWGNCYCVLSCSLQSLGFFGTAKKEMYCTRIFWYWEKINLARSEYLYLKGFSEQSEPQARLITSCCLHWGGLSLTGLMEV